MEICKCGDKLEDHKLEKRDFDCPEYYGKCQVKGCECKYFKDDNY